MKTINANSNGADFISDINDNFAECMTGGGNGNVAIKVPLQGGDLKASTGYVDGRWCAAGASNGVGTWTDDNFYKYLHTPCYLSLKGNKVKSVTVPTGSTLTIFCYDDTFTLISGGVVNAVANIPEDTAYVKMQLYNSNGYSQVLTLEMTLAAEPKWVKNTGAAYTPQWFNYDCKPTKIWDDAASTTLHTSPTDTTLDVDNTRYHDNACVMLPPNYSPDGEPCKVVFFFNGDLCTWFIMHDIGGVSTVYGQNFRYLNACGYAVVMCYGYTSMWKDLYGATNGGGISRIQPAYIASVRALYDRIMRNYNFDPQVYIGAKSAGGGMLLHTSITLPFPVRAAAGLSAAVCNFDMMRWSTQRWQREWQRMLGAPDWSDFILTDNEHGINATIVHNGSGANANQLADATRLADNKDIYRRYDPFGMLSDIDWDAFVTQCLLLKQPYNNGADYPTALTDVVYGSSKPVPTPIKYWCATKDGNVPYTWCSIIVEWINRNGGMAELRSYTESDGNHYTFCGSTANGGKVANNLPTPYGGTISGVNIGIVEAVEWFKRW